MRRPNGVPGMSNSRSTTRAIASSSGISSSARRFTARSWRLPGSRPPPRRRACRTWAAAAHREGRAARDAHARAAVRRAPVRRSGRARPDLLDERTTGTPSYIPLTASDLDNWVTGSARSYAASGIGSGDTVVTTYNAGPFVAGAALDAFQRIGVCHVPVGTGTSDRLLLAIEQLKTDRDRADAVLRRVSARARRPARLERAPRARRRRAGRRRAGVPREARSRVGRDGHGGDGDRRHRPVALGRVRASRTACTSARAASSRSS